MKLAQKKINDPKTGEELTFADALLRKCATSDEPALIKLFVEYTFGKVPDKIEGTGFTAPIVILREQHETEAPRFEASRE